MAYYPLKDHLEWWYREFVGRGARDLIWLSYTDWPSDEPRQIADESNSLYCTYTNYIDYFDPECDLSEGQIPSPDWAAENCMYDEQGDLIRGYHESTRLLPNLYVKWATQGKLQKRFYNLKDYREIMRVNSFFFDVHARLPAVHYFDHKGTHYSSRDFLRHTADLFALAREYGEDAPVFSNCGYGGEWHAGAMEGGWANNLFEPKFWGIEGEDWEYYPNVDQVHRRHFMSVGATRDNGEKEWDNRKARFQQQVTRNVLFGRAETIYCYWPTDISRFDTRLMGYYLHSAFHRMLGMNGMREIEFADGDLHRQVVHYEHGATIWVNRGDEDWVVDGRRLKEACYLIKGTDFLQYCEVPAEKDFIVEFVKSPDYWLFASPEMHDFGSAKVDGAYAVRVPEPDRIVVYQIRKTHAMITLYLPDFLGRPGPYRFMGIHTVFDGKSVRRNPDYEIRKSTVEGDYLIFEPSQDPHAWRYEIEIE